MEGNHEMGVIYRPRWEYQWVEVKTSDGRSYDEPDLDRLGRDGWEVAAFLPLPKPDPEGTFNTTIGWFVLKRAI